MKKYLITMSLLLFVILWGCWKQDVNKNMNNKKTIDSKEINNINSMWQKLWSWVKLETWVTWWKIEGEDGEF